MRNRGSIRPTTDPRIWRIVISANGPDGKRRRIWRTVKGSQTDAQTAMTRLQAEVDGNQVVGSVLRLRDWLTEWLESTNVRPGTLHSYRQHSRDYIVPVIGHIRLDRIKPHHVEEVMTAVLKAGRSAGTAKRVYATLHRALHIAERRELARNVARNVEPPRERLRRQRIDLDAIEQILKVLDGDPQLSRFYRVAFSTGLRRGELHGMTWANTDLDRGFIQVTQTLQRQTGKGLVVAKPKSESSNRLIHLDADTISILREQGEYQLAWRRDHPELWMDTGFVWSDELGMPVAPERLTKGFKRAAIAVGFPELHLHHLRHAHALALVEMKAHPRTVQQRLGHSSAAFTMAVYVSDSDALDKEAADLFGMRFGRNSGRKTVKKTSPQQRRKVLQPA